MELQGKKVTHDFLSLCSPDSSFQLQDPRASSQGLFLKTRDFLQPLEREGKGGEAADGGSVPAERNASSISHVGAGQGAEKPEGSALRVLPIGLQTKPEPDYGSRSTTTSYGSYAGGVSYTLWDDNDTASRGQWPPPSLAALVATKHTWALEKKRFMEAAASRSSRGYQVDDEEEAFGKRQGSSSSHKDSSIKAEGKAFSSEETPNTPRSKHSATEHRRRTKINDRFQILRELIPHSDQKRDKASFLLEVIEYIRFLQEKAQNYESSYPGWNQDEIKLMPWKKNPASENASQIIRNDSAAPAQILSEKLTSNMPSTMVGSPATDVPAGNSCKTTEAATRFASNMAIHDQSPWSVRSCRDMLNEPEELALDEGTISVSAAYSHGLLNTLTQALQSSGVDLSRASISVQINLGKRAKRPAATATIKEQKDPASIFQSSKRRKAENS
ncbi:transcription factor BIM2-like isoform X2 [Musa acuminata AAA Group]|uniref:transcription factor BIM2-like isoform X2 n=1 Tax=Musa acuminata AAA Group TaxID=214697 RepID=UPI0031D8DA04